jgi:hypothetical protein
MGSLFTQPSGDTLVGKVFHAKWGSTMTMNSWAIVLRETQTQATLLPLKTKVIDGDANVGIEEEARQQRRGVVIQARNEDVRDLGWRTGKIRPRRLRRASLTPDAHG